MGQAEHLAEGGAQEHLGGDIKSILATVSLLLSLDYSLKSFYSAETT